ncbi:DUF1439 domain-containing protein [Allohahella marinimesophila]
MFRTFMLSTLLLLASCASLSPYSIGEAELKGYLLETLQEFDRQQLKSGSPLGLRIDDADVDIGPDGREVIRLKLGGTASVNALLASIPADFSLDIEGTPVFDNEEKAVYVRRFALNDANLQLPFIKQDLKPVTRQIMAVVTQYLEQVPVYRLEADSMASRISSLKAMQIKVLEGKLTLVPESD